MLIDPDIYSKKERTNIAIGVYLRPLCKVCPRICREKRAGKIFPTSLLSPFKKVFVAFVICGNSKDKHCQLSKSALAIFSFIYYVL